MLLRLTWKTGCVSVSMFGLGEWGGGEDSTTTCVRACVRKEDGENNKVLPVFLLLPHSAAKGHCATRPVRVSEVMAKK